MISSLSCCPSKILLVLLLFILRQVYSNDPTLFSQSSQKLSMGLQQDAPGRIFEPIPSTIINLEGSSNLNNENFLQSFNIQVQTYMSLKHPSLNVVYVAGINGGLFVVDIFSQSNVQHFNITCKKVFQRNDRLFASRGKEGFSVYQIDATTGYLSLICDSQIGSSVDSIYVDSTLQYLYIGSEGYVYLVQVANQGLQSNDYIVVLHVGIYSGDTNYIYSVRNEKYLMVANLINGVSIINIAQKDRPYLVTQKLPKWQVIDLRVAGNGQYVYAIEEWYGLYIGDFSSLYQNESQFKANDKVWINNIDFQTISRAIEISSDENLLFVGLRSIGVSVYDISTPDKKINPVLIQKVYIEGLANHIFLFNSDNSFLYVNGCCIAIVNQVEANYNDDVPNVFNTHISRQFQYWTQNTWPWEYTYSNDSSYLYLASAFEGMHIYQLSNSTFLPPKEIFASNTYPQTSTDTVAIIQEKNLLVQGSSEKGVILWNITNINQIKKIGEFNHPLANSDSDGIIYNKKLNCLAIANGYQGAYLLDISDYSNMKIISEINIIDYDLQVTAETIQMTQDANYLVLSLRYYGILIFNMKYLKSPNLINNFHTYGGEKCVLSQDENYIFVSDSFKGLSIINFENKENAFLQSNLNLKSQVQYAFQSLINSNILYLSLIENGQLVLVDVSDKNTPFVLAKVQYNNERCTSLKEAPNQQYITYLTSNGLRFQSIQFSIRIHTQSRKILKQSLNQSESSYASLNPKDAIQVGDTVEFFFSSILFGTNIILQQVFYYKDFQMSQLETWMHFSSSKNILRMTVDKNALTESNGHNILLLQILQKINLNSFISPLYGIAADQSTQIYLKLKQRAIINDQDYVNLNNFYINSNFYVDLDNSTQYSNLTATEDFIKQVMLQSIYYQPIRFRVVSSLFLNIKYVELNQSPIQTISPSVKITITIQDTGNHDLKGINSSYFIENTNNQSTQINLSSDFKTLSIEGLTVDVNQVLLDGVDVVFHQDAKDVSLKVSLLDSVNFELVQVYNGSMLNFLKNAKDQNTTYSLQQQFQDQITEELTVKKDYSFTFASTTFQYQLPQSSNLNFEAFLKYDDNHYISIDNVSWIDFDESRRQFKWCGGLSQLSSRYTVVVNATTVNGRDYWVSDSFEIYFDRMPVEIIVIICLTSFFVVMVFTLLYCYRAKIQHIRYFFKYTYSSEPAFVNKSFSKIIILIPNYLQEFHKLWKQFIKNERQENKSVKINFKKYLTQTKEIDVPLLIEKLKSIFDQNKHFYSKLKEQEFKITNTRLSYLTKGAFSNLMLQEDLATFEVFNQLKSIAKKKGFRKDWYKFYTKIIYPEKLNEKQQIPTIEESHSHSNFDSHTLNSQLELGFPMIFIDESKIYFTLEEANSNSTQKNEAFNHYLLFENIKAEGYGYVTKCIKNQEVSYGETIHISHNNIKRIVAFRKKDDESKSFCLPKVRSKYLLDFVEIQNMKNSSLPDWLKCDISQSAITFSGKPSSSDVGDILIRIYDNNRYILNQFFINIRKMRKQNYQTENNPDVVPFFQQMQQQQQTTPMQQPFLTPQISNYGYPSNRLSSAPSYTNGVTNIFLQQSPHQINSMNSPIPSSTQVILQPQGHKRILKNSRHQTQRYSIKQYQQFLKGESQMQRLRSENQIKDYSNTPENVKKNSDGLILSKPSTLSPTNGEDTMLTEKERNLPQVSCFNHKEKFLLSQNNSSQNLKQPENQPELRVIREETIFSQQTMKRNQSREEAKSKNQLSANEYNAQPQQKSHKSSLDDSISGDEKSSDRKNNINNNKSIFTSIKYRNNQQKSTIHFHEDTQSFSILRNQNDQSELEKSLGLISCEPEAHSLINQINQITQHLKNKFF